MNEFNRVAEERRLQRERKKASKAGTLDISLVGVLKRRAQDLRLEGYNEQYVGPLERATEDIRARMEFDDKDEQAYVEAIADNRRLRSVLAQVGQRLWNIPFQSSLKRDILAGIGNALKSVKAPGEGRTIVAVQIGTADTFDTVMVKLGLVVGQHFGIMKKVSDGEIQEARDEEASAGGAGRDDVPASEPGRVPEDEPGATGGRRPISDDPAE